MKRILTVLTAASILASCAAPVKADDTTTASPVVVTSPTPISKPPVMTTNDPCQRC